MQTDLALKIVVVNRSGNVGKSTVAHHVLLPRLKAGTEVISVESINSDDDATSLTRGKDFEKIERTAMLSDSLIIDVGSSNVEDFLGLMARSIGSHEDIDVFVIPTVPTTKQMKDTIATIRDLQTMGVPPTKIRILFNTLPVNESVSKLFPDIFDFYKKNHNFILNEEAFIYETDFFAHLKKYKLTIEEILSDETDLRAELKTATDSNEKMYLADRIALKRQSLLMKQELDAAFDALIFG